MELAYGYLPLVWAANLSHYLLLFLGEAGRILPVCAGARRCAPDTLCLLISRSATDHAGGSTTWRSAMKFLLCRKSTISSLTVHVML